MKNQIEQVKEFYRTFKQPMGEGLRYNRAILRSRLLDEEAGELKVATIRLDKVESLDAIIDCMYILIGTAIELGLEDKLEAGFAEVHRSNMSKLDENGNPIFREDGKIIKGANYSKPDLAKVLSEG